LQRLLVGFVGFERSKGLLHGGKRGVLRDSKDGRTVRTDEIR
jgi:hypothetical protein